MKKLALISAFFIAVGFMSSCSNTAKSPTTNNQPSTTNDQLPKGVYYTCEMHPEIHSDKPGDCPKCGMKLIRSDSIKK